MSGSRDTSDESRSPAICADRSRPGSRLPP
jgi:hypothetical protein